MFGHVSALNFDYLPGARNCL